MSTAETRSFDLEVLLIKINQCEEKIIQKSFRADLPKLEFAIDSYENDWLQEMSDLEMYFTIDGVISQEHLLELIKHMNVIMMHTDSSSRLRQLALPRLKRYQSMMEAYQGEMFRYSREGLTQTMMSSWEFMNYIKKKGISDAKNIQMILDACSKIEMCATLLRCTSVDLFYGLYLMLDLLIIRIPSEKVSVYGGELVLLQELSDYYLKLSAKIIESKQL